MMKLAIKEVITDQEELLNSEYIAKIFEPYASTELDRFKRVQRRIGFKSAYVVEIDDRLNYGRPFRVYIESTATDGLRVLNEASAGGMLSSAPMRVINIDSDSLELTNEYINKDEEGRAKAIKEGLLVF